MEKIKRIPFIVILGLIALVLLYAFSIYTQSQTDVQKHEISDAKKIENENNDQSAAIVQENKDQEKLEFTNHLAELFDQLPRKGFAEKSNEEVHATPNEVLKNAIELGKVADLFSQKSALKPIAFNFYLKCANESEIIPQIRAVCYERAQELSLSIEQKKLTLDVPKEVLDLVGQ